MSTADADTFCSSCLFREDAARRAVIPLFGLLVALGRRDSGRECKPEKELLTRVDGARSCSMGQSKESAQLSTSAPPVLVQVLRSAPCSEQVRLSTSKHLNTPGFFIAFLNSDSILQRPHMPYATFLQTAQCSRICCLSLHCLGQKLSDFSERERFQGMSSLPRAFKLSSSCARWEGTSREMRRILRLVGKQVSNKPICHNTNTQEKQLSDSLHQAATLLGAYVGLGLGDRKHYKALPAAKKGEYRRNKITHYHRPIQSLICNI